MNPKVKSNILLFIMLIIGIAIGFEISEIFVQQRFDKIESFRKPKGFIEIFDSVIEPSKEQKTKTDEILLKYHNNMERIAKESMTGISIQVDSMRTELKAVLDENQLRRLDEEIQRMKRMPPPPTGDRMGPPMPGGKPMQDGGPGRPMRNGGPMPPNGRPMMPPPGDNGGVPPPPR